MTVGRGKWVKENEEKGVGSEENKFTLILVQVFFPHQDGWLVLLLHPYVLFYSPRVCKVEDEFIRDKRLRTQSSLGAQKPVLNGMLSSRLVQRRSCPDICPLQRVEQ